MASSYASDSFKEHIGVMKALSSNYQSREDVENVAKLEGMLNSIVQMCMSREQDAHTLIRGLTERVKNTERDAVYPADERAHAARLADLSADIETNRHAISRLNASMETASQQHEAVREQAVAQAASQAEMAQQLEEAEPNKRHQLSLYAHITKVSWHFEKAQLVSGTVSDPGTGDIRPFEFDPAAMTQFEVVNKLWDLL